jgi:hydrogenase maturation factor HypF (carbamoyltransferase family)
MQKFITCRGCGAQWYAIARQVPWSYKLTIPRSLLICRECGTDNMKAKRTKAPQSELPTVSTEAFNLSSETAIDGERVRQEMEVAAQNLQQAKELEQEQQPSLI